MSYIMKKLSDKKIIKEWHYKKNGGMSPKDFSIKSHIKVWWICEKGHEWETKIYNRTAGTGCTYCFGRFATEENNLYLSKNQLAEEWHSEKNKPLTPKDVTPQSHKEVWWICKNGHEWVAKIFNRYKGTGCPHCKANK